MDKLAFNLNSLHVIFFIEASQRKQTSGNIEIEILKLHLRKMTLMMIHY